MANATVPSNDPLAERKSLETYLRQQIAAALGISATRLDLGQPVNGLGLDSLMIYSMKRQIRADLGVGLPAVRFFEKVTIRELASELSAELGNVRDGQRNDAPKTSQEKDDTKTVDRQRERMKLLRGYWRGVGMR